MIAIITVTIVVIRKWRRNYRERRELASFSTHERYELSFIGDVGAEIAKPFWRD